MCNRKKQIEKEDNLYLAAYQGVQVGQIDDLLTADTQLAAIMDHFHLREKITHFDHQHVSQRDSACLWTDADRYDTCLAKKLIPYKRYYA